VIETGHFAIALFHVAQNQLVRQSTLNRLITRSFLFDSNRCCLLYEGEHGQSFALMTVKSRRSGLIASWTQNGPYARVAPQFPPPFLITLATRVFTDCQSCFSHSFCLLSPFFYAFYGPFLLPGFSNLNMSIFRRIGTATGPLGKQGPRDPVFLHSASFGHKHTEDSYNWLLGKRAAAPAGVPSDLVT
jgi:hypothetical protein